MKYILITFIFVFASIQIQSQDCNCSEQFAFAKQKITANYSGYKDKVTSENQTEYDVYTKGYEQKTAKARQDSTCFRLIYEWTRWFKDGHIQMGTKSRSPDEIRAQFADWEKVELTEEGLKEKLNKRDINDVEGIWESDGGSYRCGIIKKQNSERDYVAFVIQADSIWWMPGQIKFELRNNSNENEFSVNYYMQNHSQEKAKAQLINKVLHIEGLGFWKQIYPEMAEVETQVAEEQKMYQLSRLDDETLLLVIPTMSSAYTKEMDQLIKENKELIKSTPNLVIDCRNNGGGSDYTYFSLRQFIYTNPIIDYHGQTYCTLDNVELMNKLSKDKNFSFIRRMGFRKQYKKQSKHIGEYIGKKGTFKRRYIGKKHNYPENIAVIINEACGSSCESFAFMCNQSNKVTLMGQNTSGVSDYGNLNSIPFPNNKWVLYYATTRNSAVDAGKGIDNIGIPPHIRLDETNEDWIEFAKDYLKTNK